MRIKTPYLLGGSLVILVLAAFVAKSLILNGAKVVKPAPAAALVGSVEQSLSAGGKQSKQPLSAKDFAISNIRYFDAKSWVVATISPTAHQFDQGLVVLKNVSGLYEVELGPGSAFPNSILYSLPADVGSYLNSQGLLYGPGE